MAKKIIVLILAVIGGIALTSYLMEDFSVLSVIIGIFVGLFALNSGNDNPEIKKCTDDISDIAQDMFDTVQINLYGTPAEKALYHQMKRNNKK